LQALGEEYEDRGVQALVIDVLEDRDRTAAWAKKVQWSIPVLLDLDGKVAEAYAPEGVLPDLPRNQIPIASNLIIDQEGKIQFYSLLDSRHFDAKLIALTARLDELLTSE
jgi:peroxiredoxin